MAASLLTILRYRHLVRRRAWALALVAWLGFLAQPAFAALLAGDMAHCPHAGAGMDMPCHVMTALDCGPDSAANVVTPPAPAAVPTQTILIVPGTGQSPGIPGGLAPRGGTDPPVRIRFCSLNN